MANKYIVAIDPGTTESGVCIIDSANYKPIAHGKFKNESVYDFINENMKILFSLHYREDSEDDEYEFAIEMIASYGKAVGIEVFETCVWIGRFTEMFGNAFKVSRIYRKDEKMNLCGSMKAKDPNIIQALVDRFAPGEKNYGKGTKKNPGWFYNFNHDVWQAYAVGVTYIDIQREKERKNDH